MSDLDYQNLSPVQSKQQPTPMRYAATAANDTLAPTTALTVITSSNSASKTIRTITPPVTGYHELSLMGTDASPTPLVTGGNIGVAYTIVQNRPVRLYYDPVLALYYPMAVS
jgi:hypothetical protein